MTINTLGPKGHIAFDHFQGHDNNEHLVIGEEKAIYDHSGILLGDP